MFGAWTFSALWDFIFGSVSLAVAIGLAASAVAVLEPAWLSRFVPHLRPTAIVVALVAFAYPVVGGKFYNAGLVQKKTEWDAGKQQEISDGAEIRTDAERIVRDATPDSVRRDPRNRDLWKKQD